MFIWKFYEPVERIKMKEPKTKQIWNLLEKCIAQLSHETIFCRDWKLLINLVSHQTLSQTDKLHWGHKCQELLKLTRADQSRCWPITMLTNHDGDQSRWWQRIYLWMHTLCNYSVFRNILINVCLLSYMMFILIILRVYIYEMKPIRLSNIPWFSWSTQEGLSCQVR